MGMDYREGRIQEKWNPRCRVQGDTPLQSTPLQAGCLPVAWNSVKAGVEGSHSWFMLYDGGLT